MKTTRILKTHKIHLFCFYKDLPFMYNMFTPVDVKLGLSYCIYAQNNMTEFILTSGYFIDNPIQLSFVSENILA